jgi:hypothetical protein
MSTSTVATAVARRRYQQARWSTLVERFHRFDRAAAEELLLRLHSAAAEIRTARGPRGVIQVSGDTRDALLGALAVELLSPEMSPPDRRTFGATRRLYMSWELLRALDSAEAPERRLRGWLRARLLRAWRGQHGQRHKALEPEQAAAPPEHLEAAAVVGGASLRWAGVQGGGLFNEGEDPTALASAGGALPAAGERHGALDTNLLLLLLFNASEDPWRLEGLGALWRALAPELEGPCEATLRSGPPALMGALGGGGYKPGRLYPLLCEQREEPDIAARLSRLGEALGHLDRLVQQDPALSMERRELRRALDGLLTLVGAQIPLDRWPALLAPKIGGQPRLVLVEHELPRTPVTPRVASWMVWHAAALSAASRRGLRRQVAERLSAWGFSANIYNSLSAYLGQLNPLIDAAQALHTSPREGERP